MEQKPWTTIDESSESQLSPEIERTIKRVVDEQFQRIVASLGR